MSKLSPTSYKLALRDFQYARKQAVMQQLLARFRGDGARLLPFNEIKQQFGPTGETIKHGIQEIALDKIVGSVGRYEDFTRSFLPKRDADEERWAGVRAAVRDMVGIPPIEVYQVGDAYFVQDGNHRVSIARRLNSKTITAYVTEIKTRVPFSADDDPNEVICKANYADFLERSNLDKLRPEADLIMTFCGNYHIFLEQIEIGFSGPGEKQGSASDTDGWDEAVVDWYDDVYLPIIRIIRELGVLHRFPERTEADMYLLLSERRNELEEDLGWKVDLETGVSDLISYPMGLRGRFKRVFQSLAPAAIGMPMPGLWRQQQLARGRYHHLFKHILVPLDGSDENWDMFEDFLESTSFDQDHLLGLTVVSNKMALDSDRVRSMRARFNEGIQRIGLQGQFAVEIGSNPVQVINRRAAWVDFVIVNGTRPPGNVPLARISPQLRLLVQQCPRPIQVRPDGSQSDYSRAILAYDGSPKADEALFIATYLTSRWAKSLTVVTVETEYTKPPALERARSYLRSHGLNDVNYVLKKGAIAEMVMETAEAFECNMLFMGGFSFPSLRQLTLGSSAERILCEFPYPMWICR